MKTILLVQQEISPLLLERLEAAGYEVRVASDVPSTRDALACRPDGARRLDGAIIDLGQPGYRGIDVRNLLRREFPALPMLLIAPAGREDPGPGRSVRRG